MLSDFEIRTLICVLENELENRKQEKIQTGFKLEG